MTASGSHRDRAGPLRRLAARLPRLPAERRSAPVPYSPRLVVYVAALAIGAAAAAAATVRPPVNPGLLALGGCATLALAATAVGDIFGFSTHWSTSSFAHLGLSLTAGPAGALVAALGEEVGSEPRFHAGWFKGLFNVTHDFLGNLAAWGVFEAATGGHPTLASGLLGGLAAGAVQYAINIGLLITVLRLADPDLRVGPYLGHNAVNTLPYHLGAGCTAFGAYVLVASQGAGGFLLLLVPVGLLQAFLLVLAVRTRAAQSQREAHMRERELLRRRALEAHEAERRRIARNLHDGVVQDLAAVTFGLRERAEHSGGDGAGAMLRAADTTAEAIDELRTLLREIAPPDLQEVGLAPALDELAESLRDQGITVRIGLDQTAASVRGTALDAAFRIAQEGLRNVAEHAQASQVGVAARRLDAALALEISDNGIGFSAEERQRRVDEGHLGLSLLHDLARDAGGELTIESAPRQGTTLRATLPVAEDDWQ